MLRRCQQIKAKYRAKFQDHDHDDDEPDSNFDGGSEDGGVAASDEIEDAEDDDNYGRGDSDDPIVKDAPQGIQVYQKASAWYHVAYSDVTNPFIAEGRKAGKGDGSGRGEMSKPHMIYLSFPWICAYEHLCQMKEMSLRHGRSELP